MATLKEQTSKLTLVLATGIDASGQTTFTNQTISDVNKDVSDSDFCNVAEGMSSLTAYTLSEFKRVDTKTYEPDE